RGYSCESAMHYPIDETRKALFEGANRAKAAIGDCKPYKVSLPIQAKKQYLVLGKPGTEPKLVTKEGTIDDLRRLLDF
ncbi:MAG: hypothetical protein ABFD16_10570, partial [Thermoguttaceae bacterium]